MASESSNGREQTWISLPSLPRISVTGSSRARLAHRRPISISLPSKVPSSSASRSGGESSDVLNSSREHLLCTESAEPSRAVPPISSLPPGVASSENTLGPEDSSRTSSSVCDQSNTSAAFSAGPLSLQKVTEDAPTSSISDDSIRNTSSDASIIGLVPCRESGSAKPCDDSNINPQQKSPDALSHSCMPGVDADSQKQEEKSGVEPVVVESNSLDNDDEAQTSFLCNVQMGLCADGAPRCEEDISSLSQTPALEVKVAEFNKILGLDSEESEPEDGQLPGEWSGSDDSFDEGNQNSDFKVEDNSTAPLVLLEGGFAVPQSANFTKTQFRSGDKSSLSGCSNPGSAGRASRIMETAKKKKKKKHKKGEGSKKRAREKSSQKYKELKSKKLKANAGEHLGKSPVERLGHGEQYELQNTKRRTGENANQEPKSQTKSNSKDELLEEGEIPEPTQTNNGLLFSLVEDEVGLWTTDDIDDQLVAQMEEDGAVKKKRGPETAERMLKRKIAKRKKRAQKERELGIRRPPRNYVSKPVKVLCTHFMKGRCAKGEKCTFSHDAVPLTKQEPCKFLMSHSCLKGDDCPYSHDLKAFPCKFFHTRGLCYDGDNCLFSHGPITEEAREKILKRVEKEKKERASNTSGLDIPTPIFSSPLPAEEDPDPLGWGTSNFCPSFDVDLRPRSPGTMDTIPNCSGEAEYGDLLQTSHYDRSNLETSSYSTADVAEKLPLYDAYHPSKENMFEKLDHIDMECTSWPRTTGATTTLDTADADMTPSDTEVSALNLAGPLFPAQRGSLFENRVLEPKGSVPSLTQTTGSRKLTIESLLGEVLRH